MAINQSTFHFNVCSHQGDIRQTNKQIKPKKVNTELDLDKNIHPDSPIHLLRTNIIKVTITCLQDYELSMAVSEEERNWRAGV